MAVAFETRAAHLIDAWLSQGIEHDLSAFLMQNDEPFWRQASERELSVVDIISAATGGRSTYACYSEAVLRPPRPPKPTSEPAEPPHERVAMTNVQFGDVHIASLSASQVCALRGRASKLEMTLDEYLQRRRTTKLCTFCGQWLPYEHFGRVSGVLDQRKSRCKHCQQEVR